MSEINFGNDLPLEVPMISLSSYNNSINFTAANEKVTLNPIKFDTEEDLMMKMGVMSPSNTETIPRALIPILSSKLFEYFSSNPSILKVSLIMKVISDAVSIIPLELSSFLKESDTIPITMNYLSPSYSTNKQPYIFMLSDKYSSTKSISTSTESSVCVTKSPRLLYPHDSTSIGPSTSSYPSSSTATSKISTVLSDNATFVTLFIVENIVFIVLIICASCHWFFRYVKRERTRTLLPLIHVADEIMHTVAVAAGDDYMDEGIVVESHYIDVYDGPFVREVDENGKVKIESIPSIREETI